jgi:hypothetical protein
MQAGVGCRKQRHMRYDYAHAACDAAASCNREGKMMGHMLWLWQELRFEDMKEASVAACLFTAGSVSCNT